MSINWDALVLAPVMAVFGEGRPVDPTTIPIYTPRGFAPFLILGAVFDEFYADVSVNPDGETSTNLRPILGVRLAPFPRIPAQNDTVMIPRTGKTYIVKDVQPDGHGHAKLMLMEAATR